MGKKERQYTPVLFGKKLLPDSQPVILRKAVIHEQGVGIVAQHGFVESSFPGHATVPFH